jgi:hypothetical protein
VSGMVSIMVAADGAEADEVQALLAEAGIASTLEPAESLGIGSVGAGPCRVLVAADDRDAAVDALRESADDDGDDDDGW